MGYARRSELAMRRVLPELGATPLQELPGSQLRVLFARQLPIWVHNIITDPTFPGREKLLMPLRRFEGEMRDNREDEVVAAVLSAGFRNRQLDPLDLPDNMPMRQRCSLVMQASTWQEAYRRLESDLCAELAEHAGEVQEWMASSQPEVDCELAM